MLENGYAEALQISFDRSEWEGLDGLEGTVPFFIPPFFNYCGNTWAGSVYTFSAAL